eukprot:g24948.t1
MSQTTIIVQRSLPRFKLSRHFSFHVEQAPVLHCNPTAPSETKGGECQSKGAGKTLSVLFGSNMGASHAIASQKLLPQAAAMGFEVNCMSLDAWLAAPAACRPVEDALVIIASTYNGHPPENAKAFDLFLNASLNGPLNASLNGPHNGPHNGPRGDVYNHMAACDRVQSMPYAVFGCGNSHWKASFLRFPHSVHTRLQSLGGRPLLEFKGGDVAKGLEAAVNAWLGMLWPQLHRALNLQSSPPVLHAADCAYLAGLAPRPGPLAVSRRHQRHKFYLRTVSQPVAAYPLPRPMTRTKQVVGKFLHFSFSQQRVLARQALLHLGRNKSSGWYNLLAAVSVASVVSWMVGKKVRFSTRGPALSRSQWASFADVPGAAIYTVNYIVPSVLRLVPHELAGLHAAQAVTRHAGSRPHCSLSLALFAHWCVLPILSGRLAAYAVALGDACLRHG